MQDRKGEKGQVWQCVANVLRSHAAAVPLFRQLVPKGKIGMALNSDWCEPLTSSAEDQVHGPGMQLCCLLCICKLVADSQPVTWQAAAARQMGTPGAQQVSCIHVLHSAAKQPSVSTRHAPACI